MAHLVHRHCDIAEAFFAEGAFLVELPDLTLPIHHFPRIEKGRREFFLMLAVIVSQAKQEFFPACMTRLLPALARDILMNRSTCEPMLCLQFLWLSPSYFGSRRRTVCGCRAASSFGTGSCPRYFVQGSCWNRSYQNLHIIGTGWHRLVGVMLEIVF